VVTQIRRMSAEKFDEFIMQPENADRNFELIAGEMVEKLVSNSRSSRIAAWILMKLGVFVDEHELGYVTGPDGGYIVCGERYIPDGAFLSKTRRPVFPNAAYIDMAPDLALEVLSPGNTDEELRVKIVNYLAAGTIGWVVARDKRVELHRSGQPVQVLFQNDLLDGGDLLPGFSLPVTDILPK
jgi:Uma2 family endonuclease